MEQTYVVQWDYKSGSKHVLYKDQEIKLDPEKADWFNRDSPGVLLVVEATPESSNPPVVEGRAETSPPQDRMFRTEDSEIREEVVEFTYVATLAAERLAEEHSIDLATVTGTGADGKVIKSDVEKLI